MQQRVRYSVRALLVVITVGAFVLTIGKLSPLPTLQFLAYFVTCICLPPVLFVLMLRLTNAQRRERSYMQAPLGSILLTTLSATVIAIVLVTSWMQMPALSGPIQLVGDEPRARLVFSLRVLTMFVLMSAPVVCGLIGLARRLHQRPVRIGWWLLAVSTFVLALWVVGFYEFFPSV